MKESLSFTAYYGTAAKMVTVNSPFGGGGGYHILIDHYFQGSLFFIDGKWICRPNDRSELTTADIMILGDMLSGED